MATLRRQVGNVACQTLAGVAGLALCAASWGADDTSRGSSLSTWELPLTASVVDYTFDKKSLLCIMAEGDGYSFSLKDVRNKVSVYSTDIPSGCAPSLLGVSGDVALVKYNETQDGKSMLVLRTYKLGKGKAAAEKLGEMALLNGEMIRNNAALLKNSVAVRTRTWFPDGVSSSMSVVVYDLSFKVNLGGITNGGANLWIAPVLDTASPPQLYASQDIEFGQDLGAAQVTIDLFKPFKVK